MTDQFNAVTATGETNSMSAWSMLVSIFYEPTKVFRVIKEKPTWIVPLVVVLIVSASAAYIMTPIAIADQMEQVRTNPDLTEQQKEQALTGMEFFSNPIFGVGMAVIGGLFMMFLYTGIMMLFANVIFGGKARFAQVFSLIVVSSLIWLVSSIVKTPLMLTKNSIDVRTSLAMILPSNSTDGALYHFLNTYTDVFFIWQTILLIIGVKIIYEFATQKAALAVLIPTFVFALITTGLSAKF